MKKLGSISSCILLLLLSACSTQLSEVTPSAAPSATPPVQVCLPELIVLGEQVLSDSAKYRSKNAPRLRELDTSQEMLFAVELVDDKKLSEIIERMKQICQSQK